MVVCLSHFEHIKSIRPSFLISLYFFASLLLDTARVRTEWLLLISGPYAATLTATIVAKLALLCLETVEKRRILLLTEKKPSIESTSGPFNRGFFVWLNGLLRQGFVTLLSSQTLPSVHEKLAADKTHLRFHDAWSKCKFWHKSQG